MSATMMYATDFSPASRAAFTKALQLAKSDRATLVIAHGVPHEQILRAARATKAGLVVLGTHGRTGVARFVLGSVAGRVVAGARCPVVTVRGNAGQ